ncbi:MAG: NAD(P)H-dependent oxidoreductase [Hymenobacteraceae bacterium]|nr:NAD(P)H-dependent oxidoreductase [Hymenobacteraceae bacterium]MDX5395958.1 NAD(P)H-dependent oxidoreductase [Hymenobacteraceae bacterium]MDX5443534.1 NAD(P)H-dependent oxidoreductase [Hymenobacteraceae bacterium]MDX5512019.1 NAD(P)H-dependent oxidoreductase [Hymenobacteraceae bacterium]
MNIEVIAGSPRNGSLSKRVALYVQDWLKKETTYNVGLIDCQEWTLPPIQSVYTCVDKTPDEYKPLSERIFGADAFVLVSPEYNGSYSPAMKNLLDHFPKQHHKAFGIVTASPGAMGGIRASQQMQLLVNALFGICSPYMLIVPAVDKKFSEQGELLEESFRNNVHNFISEFLWLADKVCRNK